MKARVDRGEPSPSAAGVWIRRLGLAFGAYLLGVFLLHRVAYVEDANAAMRVSSSPMSRSLATPTPAPPRRDPVTSAGVLHVHTERSHDAVGTIEEVAHAARETGLGWVIVSDHQNNEEPAPVPRPANLEGVVVLFSQERGLDREMGRVLVEGVDTVVFLGDSTEKLREVGARPGVLTIVSHPRSPSESEQWKAVDAGGTDAWEVFNVHEALFRGLTGYGTLAHVVGLIGSQAVGRLDRSVLRLYPRGFDEPSVPAFDSLYARSAITALGGVDVHPKLRLLGRLWPSYEPFMRTVVNHVILDGPLDSAPERAAAAIRDAIHRGRVFISFGDTKAASAFRMRVEDGSGEPAGVGDTSELRVGATLVVDPGPSDERFLYRVIRDGQPVGTFFGSGLSWPVTDPGAYRVEVYRFSRRVGRFYWNLRPWIFTNPIRVLPPAAGTGASRTG
jgi:hypothetical protein